MAKKKFGFLPIAGILFVVAALATGLANNQSGTEDQTALSSSLFSTSTTSEPSEEASPSRSAAAAPLVSEECLLIQGHTIEVRKKFQTASVTPQEISTTLNNAASYWSQAARSNEGSKADWLNKMAELSLSLDSFVLTGSPPDGALLQDQLFNNFGLLDQFCK